MRQVINTKRKQKEHFWDEVRCWWFLKKSFIQSNYFPQKRVDPDSQPATSFSGLKKKDEVVFFFRENFCYETVAGQGSTNQHKRGGDESTWD